MDNPSENGLRGKIHHQRMESWTVDKICIIERKLLVLNEFDILSDTILNIYIIPGP